MRLGIMQPYLFPYLGYFQLLGSVDKFVVYDDVAFIKQGWINRNRILANGREYRFTVPLRKVSSFKRINEIEVDPRSFAKWLTPFLMTVEQNYRRALYFEPVFELLKGVFAGFEGSIAGLTLRSIMATVKYLELRTPIVGSSGEYGNDQLAGAQRIIDVCKREGADEYVNPIGGCSLYAREEFSAHGIALRFIRSRPVMYPQFGARFTPDLSIIDVMMFNSPGQIGQLLREYDIG
jgi:hypothetical protein